MLCKSSSSGRSTSNFLRKLSKNAAATHMHSSFSSAKLLLYSQQQASAHFFTYFNNNKKAARTPFLNDTHKHFYDAGSVVEVDEHGVATSPFTQNNNTLNNNSNNNKQVINAKKDTEPETVVYVCILGWLGASWKHLSKYTDWYAKDCNTPCLALIPYMTSKYVSRHLNPSITLLIVLGTNNVVIIIVHDHYWLFFVLIKSLFKFVANYQARHFISKLESNIAKLEQSEGSSSGGKQKRVKTVFHVLSGNGLNMYGNIMEMLSQEPQYRHLKDRIACTIVDSAPPAITVERFTRGFLGAIMAKFARTVTKAKVKVMTTVPHSAQTDKELQEMRDRAINEHKKHLEMKEEQVIAMHQYKSDVEEEEEENEAAVVKDTTTAQGQQVQQQQQQQQQPKKTIHVGKPTHHQFNHDNDHEEMYSHWFFSPIVKAVMHFYLETLGNRIKMEAYRDRVISQLPDKPQLFIYSESDVLIPPEDIHAFIELQRTRRNLNIEELVFKDSAHVAHFKTYPHIYSSHVKEFISESVNKQ